MMVHVYTLDVQIHLQLITTATSIDDGSCTFSSSTICDVPSFTEDWSSASWDTTNGYNFGTNGWIVTDTTSIATLPGSIHRLLHMNGLMCRFTGGDGTGW